MSGISFLDIFSWNFLFLLALPFGEMKSGVNETETVEGEDGGRRGADEGDDGGRVDVIEDTEEEDTDIDDTDDGDVDTDDTGGGEVDMDDGTVVGEVGGADEIDNGGRVDVIGVTEDEDVDVDDEMDDETSTRGWDVIERTGSVVDIDSGRETAGNTGGPDCSKSLLFTPSSSSSTCWSRLDSKPAPRIPEISTLA